MDSLYADLTNQYLTKEEGYYDHERREMLEFLPQGIKKILDVGCSSGSFGRLIKAHTSNCEVWGIEPNESAAEEARLYLDRVVNETFHPGLSELSNQVFDCVIFNDVLEHLAAPELALKASKEHLSANGVVVASIPNILYFPVIAKILVDQDWKYEDWGVLDNTHLRFFTKKSILRFFTECGFDVIKIQGINPCWGKKYNFWNLLLLNRLKDWRFQQFAVQAKAHASDEFGAE